MLKEKGIKKPSPSMDKWLKEVKADPKALDDGMILIHNGVVRKTPKAEVRQGIQNGTEVTGMEFSYDEKKVEQVIEDTLQMQGITHAKVWMNQGYLQVGDDIMYVLIGGDIRPRVIDALQFLVGKIKNECVIEIEQQEMIQDTIQ